MRRLNPLPCIHKSESLKIYCAQLPTMKSKFVHSSKESRSGDIASCLISVTSTEKKEEHSVIMASISLGIIGVIDFAAVTRYRPSGESFLGQELNAEMRREGWREMWRKVDGLPMAQAFLPEIIRETVREKCLCFGFLLCRPLLEKANFNHMKWCYLLLVITCNATPQFIWISVMCQVS